MTKKEIQTHLIAHTNDDGTGVAQVRIQAMSETEAIQEFRRRMPQRRILRTAPHTPYTKR